MLNPIAAAIPLFLVSIAAELGIAYKQGRQEGGGKEGAGTKGKRPVFRTAPMVADLGCGISSQFTGLFLNEVIAVSIYQAVSRLAPFPLPSTLYTWVFAFILVDFFYYWWHRASHRINLMWAAHVVHHQSEDFNLAVALRQSMLTPLTSIPFYLPVLLIGVPPIIFLTCVALNTLYQFWFHTRLIQKTPYLDWLFNTPTHHRVHHGINPWAIDRNHAGVFIIWDKLFGTFIEEKEEPIYGVVEGYNSWNAIRANLDPLKKLVLQSQQLQGLDKLLIWFRPPEWRPEGNFPIPEPAVAIRRICDASVLLQYYLAFWVLATSVAVFMVLAFTGASWIPLVAVQGLLVTASLGRLLDQKKPDIEAMRLGILGASGFFWGPLGGALSISLAFLSGLVLYRICRQGL